MAAPNHHHHHHHHHRNCRPAAASSCCVCNCCYDGGSPPPPPPQQSPLTDPLLQALAAHLLQLQPSQTQTTFYSHLLKEPHQTHHYSQFQHQHKHRFQERHQPQTKTHSAVAALLRRIDALEGSLRHFDYSSSASPFGYSHPSSSLRDVAARTIQTYFRAFLVRRSRTLRQLKDLAFIKSNVNALKSSVSDQTHFDSEALSHEAMNLLLKLGSIKGCDPMIRDGRRSISNELVRFLEFVDGASVKRSDISTRAVKDMRFAQNNRKSRVFVDKLIREPGREIPRFCRVCENDEDDDGIEGFHRASDDEESPTFFISGEHGFSQSRNGVLVRRSGLQPKVKKSVSFADNVNLSRVLKSIHEPIPDGDVTRIQKGVCIDDQIELVENLCKELEEAGGLSRGTEDDEEEKMENGESPPNRNCERNPRKNLRAGASCVIRGHYEDPNEDFVFSAPLPVKMESKADLMNKREALRMVS